MQAVLWCTESFTAKSRLEEHSQMITDIRFSPSMPRLATSSADKTVRVWDVDNVSKHAAFFMVQLDIVFTSTHFFKLVNGLDHALGLT